MEKLIDTHCHITVSYTHLDVYKRQGKAMVEDVIFYEERNSTQCHYQQYVLFSAYVCGLFCGPAVLPNANNECEHDTTEESSVFDF